MKRAATFGVYIALTAFVLSFGWQLRPRPTVITVGIAPRPGVRLTAQTGGSQLVAITDYTNDGVRLTAQTGDGQYVEGGDCSGCKAADGEHDDDTQCVSNFCSDGSCNDCTKPEECLSNVCDVSTGICKPPSQQDAPVCKCDISRFEGEKVYCCTSRLVDFVRLEADAYKQKVQARYAGDVEGSDYWQAQEQRWQAVRREFTNSYAALRDAANEYPQSPSQLPGYTGKTNKEAFDAFLNASPSDSQGCPHIQCADCNVKYDSYFVYNEPSPQNSSATSTPGSSSSVSSTGGKGASSEGQKQSSSSSSFDLELEKVLQERVTDDFWLPAELPDDMRDQAQIDDFCRQKIARIGNPDLVFKRYAEVLQKEGPPLKQCWYQGKVAVFKVTVKKKGQGVVHFGLVDVPGTYRADPQNPGPPDNPNLRKFPDRSHFDCLDTNGNIKGDPAGCHYIAWNMYDCEGQSPVTCEKACKLGGFWQSCSNMTLGDEYSSEGGSNSVSAEVHLLEFAPCKKKTGESRYNQIRLYKLPYKDALVGNVDRYDMEDELSLPCEDTPKSSSSAQTSSSQWKVSKEWYSKRPTTFLEAKNPAEDYRCVEETQDPLCWAGENNSNVVARATADLGQPNERFPVDMYKINIDYESTKDEVHFVSLDVYGRKVKQPDPDKWGAYKTCTVVTECGAPKSEAEPVGCEPDLREPEAVRKSYCVNYVPERHAGCLDPKGRLLPNPDKKCGVYVAWGKPGECDGAMINACEDVCMHQGFWAACNPKTKNIVQTWRKDSPGEALLKKHSDDEVGLMKYLPCVNVPDVLGYFNDVRIYEMPDDSGGSLPDVYTTKPTALGRATLPCTEQMSSSSSSAPSSAPKGSLVVEKTIKNPARPYRPAVYRVVATDAKDCQAKVLGRADTSAVWNPQEKTCLINGWAGVFSVKVQQTGDEVIPFELVDVYGKKRKLVTQPQPGGEREYMRCDGRLDCPAGGDIACDRSVGENKGYCVRYEPDQLAQCTDANGKLVPNQECGRFIGWDEKNCEGSMIGECQETCTVGGFWSACGDQELPKKDQSGWGQQRTMTADVHLLEYLPCTEDPMATGLFNEVRLYRLPYKGAATTNIEQYDNISRIDLPCRTPQPPVSSSSSSSAMSAAVDVRYNKEQATRYILPADSERTCLSYVQKPIRTAATWDPVKLRCVVEGTSTVLNLTATLPAQEGSPPSVTLKYGIRKKQWLNGTLGYWLCDDPRYPSCEKTQTQKCDAGFCVRYELASHNPYQDGPCGETGEPCGRSAIPGITDVRFVPWNTKECGMTDPRLKSLIGGECAAEQSVCTAGGLWSLCPKKPAPPLGASLLAAQLAAGDDGKRNEAVELVKNIPCPNAEVSTGLFVEAVVNGIAQQKPVTDREDVPCVTREPSFWDAFGFLRSGAPNESAAGNSGADDSLIPGISDALLRLLLALGMTIAAIVAWIRMRGK